MGKKYLDTKEGSLEQSILGVWQTAIEEKDARMDGRTKEYKEHRAKLEAARKTRSEKLVGGQKKLDKDKDGDIDAKDFAMLRKAAKKDKKEEVELDEKAAKYLEIEFKDKTTAEKAYNHINNKIEPGGNQPWDDFNQEGNSIQFENMKDADRLMKELKKKFRFKVYEREEVQVKEGKMSQLHQLMKDGKTAEEIAKIMRVDAKTIKKLMDGHMKDMKEYYEIGTDEYRKHTEDVTPGESGEWTKLINQKSESMREALAKVWGVSEGKSPFKKEEKKPLTKEVKDGKTMTGKKIAKVDVNPTIKEKAK